MAPHTHENEDDAVLAKAVAMCVLFLASMTLGTIPIKLWQWLSWKDVSKGNIYVQLLLCFGGGVLLCTTFLHLLPEVAEHLEELEIFKDVPLPMAELLMCIGFFIMYVVEECVHVYIHKKEKRISMRRSVSISRAKLDLSSSNSSLEEPTNTTDHHEHSHANHSHADHSHADHSHYHDVTNSTVVTIRGLLVVLALSIHELFEGLSVGLESSAGNVWYMFAAVSVHKLVIAFCIGVELVASGMKNLFVVIYIFTFAVVSPLGIGIGIAITGDTKSSTDIPSVILQGLATGTLLYVVFFEILSGDRKSGLKQYFAVLFGFAVMTCLTLLEA